MAPAVWGICVAGLSEHGVELPLRCLLNHVKREGGGGKRERFMKEGVRDDVGREASWIGAPDPLVSRKDQDNINSGVRVEISIILLVP